MTTEQALLQIRARRGILTPQVVVEESRRPGAPLYNRFNWNVNEAAEAHWLSTAAAIIRSVKVRRIDDADLPPRFLRGFIHLPPGEDETQGEYVPLDQAAADPRTSALVLAQMKRELNAMSRRFAGFREYVELLASEAERLAS